MKIHINDISAIYISLANLMAFLKLTYSYICARLVTMNWDLFAQLKVRKHCYDCFKFLQSQNSYFLHLCLISFTIFESQFEKQGYFLAEKKIILHFILSKECLQWNQHTQFFLFLLFNALCHRPLPWDLKGSYYYYCHWADEERDLQEVK